MYIALLNDHNVTHKILSQKHIIRIFHCFSCLVGLLSFSRTMSTVFNNNWRYRQSCIRVLKTCLVYSIFWHFRILGFNFYHTTRLYSHLCNVLENDLAYHMLVSVCLLGSNLNTCAKTEKIRPSRDTTGI